jgi:uncharacterized protein
MSTGFSVSSWSITTVSRVRSWSPDRYSPLFSVDTRNGDILWELWIEGFETAVELRPEAWKKLLNADADTAAAMRGMTALAEVGCRDQHLPRKELDTINTTAPDNIARWVITLNAWRLANYQPMQGIDSRMSSASTKKVGRNDPCPCGSGKNTRNAAASTKRHHCGAHRMVTIRGRW